MAAYGRFVRGDLEGAIDLGDRAIAAAEVAGVDCSGLAERTLGNAWFYRNDTDARRGVDGSHDRLGPGWIAGPAAHALYMRSVVVHQHG